MSYRKTFARRFRALRLRKQWTHQETADRIGVSKQAIWLWETGRKFPRPENIDRIAEVFRVSFVRMLK